jgi:RNA ligase (TIGR02306 family)
VSEFHIRVVTIGDLADHPHADTLAVTHVHGGYPCIVKKGEFQPGDLAVYLPVDAVVPETQQFDFLGKNRRIGAKKFRGIFSMGLLIPAPPGTTVGEDVQDLLGITKYEPPVELVECSETESSPEGWHFFSYTDIEGLRRYPDLLKSGEEVVLSEKIHGANARFVHDGNRLWVGSKKQIRKYNPQSLWWVAAQQANLEEKLKAFPSCIFFGEVFGRVQDLRYDLNNGVSLAFFDVFDLRLGKYLDHDEACQRAAHVGVPWVPILYRGPWLGEQMFTLAEGKSMLAKHIREGFVVKPVCERMDDQTGRVILKLPGQDYLLRRKK